jgi:ADP-heptose:LPS heptosyltransferase
MDEEPSVLVIHPGGLGDVCLSESTLLSLRQHFGDNLRGVGNERALALFSDWFRRIDSIGSRAWMPLFSGLPESRCWRAVVLIGKDRSGALRQRLGGLTDNLVFIDMYPDQERVHVAEYQLGQLREWGIRPMKKERPTNITGRLVLYPERASRKKKWPPACFLELSAALDRLGITVVPARPRDLELLGFDVVLPDALRDVAAIFAGGGMFFSNDSGMAHFAARCGLQTLTLFPDTDPVVWRPTSGLVFDCRMKMPNVREIMEWIISVREALGLSVRP